jgi:hypothetical protein
MEAVTQSIAGAFMHPLGGVFWSSSPLRRELRGLFPLTYSSIVGIVREKKEVEVVGINVRGNAIGELLVAQLLPSSIRN